jgi:hypothetical protein
LVEPRYDPVPERALAVTPTPQFILNLAALRPELRHLERLAELADESGDPTLESLAEELQSLVDRAERGVLTEEELLAELARLEAVIETLETEAPPDMRDDWAEVAETLRELLADTNVPEGLEDEVQGLLDALEQGDEAAVAEAFDRLRELIESDDLSDEDLAALADALAALADAFDPSDFDLRRELDALRDRIAELEREVEGGRGGRRTQRALDEARQRMGAVEDQLARSSEGRGPGGDERQGLADSLREAAETLREEREAPGAPPAEGHAEGTPEQRAEPESAEGSPAESPGEVGPEQLAEREGREGEERPDERGAEPGRERPEDPQGQRQPGDGERAEGQPSDGQPSDGQPGDGQPGDGQQPGGEQAEGAEEHAGTPQEQAGTPREQAGHEGAPPSREQRAAERLADAAEQMRDRQRQEARAEGRERAEQATEGMRENLQRSSGEPDREELAEETWDDFMARADGESRQPPRAPERPGEPGQAGGEPNQRDPAGSEPGQQEQADRGEGPEGGEGGQQWGTEAGGEALGEESAGLDATRERVEAQVEVTEQGAAGRPTTSEVIESAAVQGFATRGYREVYQEYAAAVEQALRSESIPPGYARFLERYFGLIEPRR